MNLNTGFFAAYNHRHKRSTVGHRVPLKDQPRSVLKSARTPVESPSSNESFLPSIPTSNISNDGRRPYRRNDFANNHVFVAKQKLARVFLDQPAVNIQSKSDLVHLFDPHESKPKNRKKNKAKQQEDSSDSKSVSTVDQDAHLSVVNLAVKPSLPSSPTHDLLPAITHRETPTTHYQTKAPRPSIAWINPAIEQHFPSPLNYLARHRLEPDTIINELLDSKAGFINKTMSPLDSSLLYVKSIINPGGAQQY